MDRTLRAT